jgi:CheY-like chemotaxis protein
MDNLMPEMDGFEATRLIRQKESKTNRHTTIIAMTANALSEDRERCLQAGMDDYVSKPMTLSALRDVLSRHIPASFSKAA